MTTRELEHSIFFALTKMGTYLCFEVQMPVRFEPMKKSDNCEPVTDPAFPFRTSKRVIERVDLISYETQGIWRFYELKVSKSDFYSKNAHTFRGHYNYFVLPESLYEQVKADIPAHIGVYTVGLRKDTCQYTGSVNCRCAKKSKKQELQVDEEKLKHAFMQALSREHEKYRLLLSEGSEASG